MRLRWLPAAAIIAALFTLQSLRHVGSGPWGVDGSYYMQVARHVAEGDGLLTSVCLYHQGLRTLPTRTNIYPLWPLLLGFAARAIGLAAAATFVPRLLYVVCLLLAYGLTVRLAPATTFNHFDYGHVSIALLGLNTAFFSTTCYPYTEGLAIALTLTAILLCDIALRRGRWPLFAVTGVVAALAFMTRSQMLLVAPAIGCVLILGIISHSVRPANVIAFVAGFTAPLLVWIAFLATFVHPFEIGALIAMHSETPGLPPYDQHVVTHGAASYLADRLRGLAVMFNPVSPLSFVHSFGPAALLVPLAAVFYLLRRRVLREIPSGVVATLLAGAAMSLALLEAHNRYFLEWLFGYRHALPFILLLAPSAIFLFHAGGTAIRLITALLLVLSLVVEAQSSVAFALTPPAEWPSAAETGFVQWIAQHDPQAIVLTTNAQTLSIASRANFRWSACQQPPETTRRLLTLVRTDYVLVYEPELGCSFFDGLQDLLRPVGTFGASPDRLFLLENRGRRR
ncbi:MAG TPA: hypothetical protein VF850_10930 [Gemmatimonadaceae bacterium]